MMEFDDPAAFAVAAMAIIAFATWIWRVPVGALRRFSKFAGRFEEDWNGVDPTPGHPGKPGVMERLQRIDGQMGRNGGSTLADVTHQTAREVSSLRAQLLCLKAGPRSEPCPEPPEEENVA